MRKYLVTGTAEVVTMLGAYKKENTALKKKCKSIEIGSDKVIDALRSALKAKDDEVDFLVIDNNRLETSVSLLQKTIIRASKGLSRNTKVNTEKLSSTQVRAILEEVLKAFEDKE